MVDEDLDVKQFCNRYVEVMGTESDHIHIVALSDALQVRPHNPILGPCLITFDASLFAIQGSKNEQHLVMYLMSKKHCRVS